MKTIYFLFIIGTNFFTLDAQAQNTEKVSAAAEEAFKQRVKILDEFFRRFNYEEGPNGTLPQDSVEIRHQALLLTLFDEGYAKSADENTKTKIKEFVTLISNQNESITLSYHDKGWYARSEWDATLDNKPVKLSLTLVTEREPNKDKWSISSAEADFLEGMQLVNSTLSPVTHDLDFMQVKKILKVGEGDLSGYAVESYTDNPLTKFFALIESGHLVLKQAPRPTYVFTQVPGWVFELNYFERKGDNTGWRISSLIKADVTTKAKYDKYLGL